MWFMIYIKNIGAGMRIIIVVEPSDTKMPLLS